MAINIKDKNGKELNIGDTVREDSVGKEFVIDEIRHYKTNSFVYENTGFFCNTKTVELVEPDSWEKFQNDLSDAVYGIFDDSMSRQTIVNELVERAKKLVNNKKY